VKHKILVATAIVASVTLIVGLGIAFVVSARVQVSATTELARQAKVTASLIEQDLEDLQFRPGGDVREQIARFRSALVRSLTRAEVLGGHDVVEAVLSIRGRTIPISEPLVVIPLLPADIGEGDVVTIDVENSRMLVAVEFLDSRFGTLSVAIGRIEPLVPVRGLMLALFTALAIGAALTISLGVWFSRSLTARLADVSDAARRVGTGDFTARAAALGGDEIADVAAAFNDMAAELQGVRDREREFLMAVSHDLRTPLTTISGYAEALDAGHVPAEDLSRVAGILFGQTEQLSRLIGDIMALARLEAKEFTLRPEAVAVAGLVDATVDTFQNRASAASINLSVDHNEDITIVADPDRLIQVLGNLLENALRYTPEDGSINLSCQRVEDGVARIVVANSGLGISSHDLPHVFERLYVADRYRAVRPAGSGLGLAIVAELVEAMGGDIVCSTPSDGGTVFTLTVGRRFASVR